MKEVTPTNRELGELSSSEQHILNNFYLSFKFSQGNAFLQGRIMVYMARSYSFEELLLLQDAVKSVEELIGRLNLPHYHTPLKGGREGIKNTFLEMWQYQKDILDYVSHGTFPEDRIGGPLVEGMSEIIPESLSMPLDQLAQKIGRGFIIQDIKHIKKERRRPHSTESDPSESFFRTYIIGGERTDSEEYNALLDHITRMIFPESPSQDNGQTDPTYEELEELGYIWGYKHPGQNFSSY